MNKLSKQQYANKNVNTKNFVTLEQLNTLQYTIIPKLFNGFSDKHKKLWEIKINNILPKNNLNFKNENDYLETNNLKKDDVITNSILHFLPNLQKEELSYLTEQFSIFSLNNKIKIFTNENKIIPIYIEIIEVLTYINKIEDLLKKYPKNYGNHHGTKFRSSSNKKLLETQLNILENRLHGTFFTLTSEDEINKTKMQIKFIKYSLKDDFKNLPEWMNFTNIYLGFDNSSFQMTDIEKETFTQLCSFFNGIKTSKEEILNSVMIYTKIQSKIKNEDEQYHKKLSQSIINILRFFFQKTINEIEKTKKKKTITYNGENILKDFYIKTYINELPVYSYIYKNSNNFFSELLELSINSILGLQTIFDENNNIQKEPSELQQLKNILKLRKEFNLSKKEFKTFLFIIEKWLIQ
jgi:hypothetical protein